MGEAMGSNQSEPFGVNDDTLGSTYHAERGERILAAEANDAKQDIAKSEIAIISSKRRHFNRYNKYIFIQSLSSTNFCVVS
jgi:hypothetical protein